jgi:hypothetical protein
MVTLQFDQHAEDGVETACFHHRMNSSIANATDSFSLLIGKEFRRTKVCVVSIRNAKVRRVQSFMGT